MSSNRNASPQKDNHQMESIQEIFRCFICMENLRDARMCPRCSKLCCNQCIRRWLSETRAQCPHCRASLHIHELVNCRWAEEVTQQLDSLQQSNPQKKNKNASALSDEAEPETEKCETHVKEELSVYCESCKCCICHECALWSTKHTNHIFKPLEEIYHQHCQQIRGDVVQLRRRFMELIGAVQDMEKNIEVVRTAKDQKVREIRQAVELMIARLDAQLKSKLMSLVSQKGAVSRQAEEIEGIMQDIESTITSGPKSELILHSGKLLTLIQDGINRSTFTVPPVAADFQSELVPSYESSTFVINNYTQLRELAEPFYSDPLNANGLTWRLKIYPDGNGVVRGTFLSVFLELTSGPADSAKYEYRIEMIYQPSNDTSKNMIREFASDFEINECWGYNRFFRIDLLESEGYLDPITDTIRLKFDVRSPTYFLKCKDQLWYISELESKAGQHGQTITELKQRIEALEAELPLESRSNGDLETAAEAEDQEENDERNKARRSRPRVQMMQLLDLTDNNDTEETVSDQESDVSDNDLLDDENDADEDGTASSREHYNCLRSLDTSSDNGDIQQQYKGPSEAAPRNAGGSYFSLMDELNFSSTPQRKASQLLLELGCDSSNLQAANNGKGDSNFIKPSTSTATHSTGNMDLEGRGDMLLTALALAAELSDESSPARSGHSQDPNKATPSPPNKPPLSRKD